MRYSIEPKNRTYVKSYGFLSFAKNMGKNIGKNLSGKYRQKLLDNAMLRNLDILTPSRSFCL